MCRRGLKEPTQVFTTRLRPGNLDEPPYADPLVGWCGGWGRKTPGYPIKHRASKLAKFFCPKIGPQDMLTKPDFMRVSASF
jgi:hypothetical protein